MRFLAFPGWMMTLSKLQDGYLNQRIILFRLQYETHSLQMHPQSSCRSAVALRPKLSEQQYTLRLVVSPCQYFPSPSPFFQPISPSLSSYISSIAVPHLLWCRIHPCCPAYLPLWSSAAIFTADLFWHPHYPAYLPRLHCHTPSSLLLFSLHYLLSSYIIRRCCLYTFSDWISSSIFVVL